MIRTSRDSGGASPEPLDCRSNTLSIELECPVFIGSSAGWMSDDPINIWHSSSIGRALDRQSKRFGVRILGMSHLSGYRINHRLLTEENVCLSFYAEVRSNYISRSLSRRNNTYFQTLMVKFAYVAGSWTGDSAHVAYCGRLSIVPSPMTHNHLFPGVITDLTRRSLCASRPWWWWRTSRRHAPAPLRRYRR